MPLKNDLLLRAAHGEETPRTPVWLMRQAGRILPEYRAIRSNVRSFLELVRTPDLAAEVTLQPVDILNVDAAIIFSDILVIPEAMGLPYHLVEKKGPQFPQTIQTTADVKSLKVVDPQLDLHYVLEAMRIVKEALDQKVPLIGFAGAPWTVMSYMVEGQGSKTFSKARRMLYDEPEMAHELLEKITTSTIAYLKAQVKAGADLVQLFDSWAGILSPGQYHEFAHRYTSRICQAIDEVPVTVFAKGAYFALPSLGELACEVIGLDWQMDVDQCRAVLGPGKTLQGNLDPCALYGDRELVRIRTENMLKAFSGQPHIANLGHGVYPDTPLENVKCFIETVKQFPIN